ncbi:MAG: penicillin-binding transpeptidase domain-containing protein [Christensenella sp.]
MFKKFKNRFFVGMAIILALFIMLGAGLGNLTLKEGVKLTTASEDKKVRTLSVKGTRGQITDVTGIPLAYDESSYDIRFIKDPSKNSTTDKAYYTDILIETIGIIEQSGGATIDTFNLKRAADGSFAFDFGITDEKAIADREANWRKNMFVSKKAAPDVLYRDLRTRYRIPEEYTYEQARKLLSIWQEVQLSAYRAYEPVTICKDVQMDTVSLIEAKSDVLDGIEIGESATRVYPKDEVAAHIVGYLGKMNDAATIKDYKAKGYAQGDLIGAAGIESTMEQYLTGNSTEKQGKREVEVNNKGKVIKEHSSTPATNGYDVRLTLDLQLQQVVERALKDNVEYVHQEQLDKYAKAKPEEYDADPDIQAVLKNREGASTLEKMNLAKSGAAVVLDVNTGKVLSMANYPSYDANVFTGGIAEADMKALNEDPARPLFNNAISSKGIPGSIFKMVTGLAGLEEGAIGLNTRIDDMGEYKLSDDERKQEQITGHIPVCWAYKPGMTTVTAHSNQDITEGLKNSCNYFFYDVADKIAQTTDDTSTLSKWGEKLGLTTSTGIELTGEVVGQVGNQSVLYDPTKPISTLNSEGVEVSGQKTSLPLLVRNALMNLMRGYGEQLNITYTDEQLKKTAEKLITEAGKDPTNFTFGDQIRAILSEELQINKVVADRNGWVVEINGLLSELRWNKRQTIVTGIGSGTTAVTPIAVARYIAAIANGGTVYETHIVDSVVDDKGNTIEKQEPVVFNQITENEGYFDVLREGMTKVVSEETSTASSYFKGWKYENNFAGKTGTGTVSNIDLENNAWFVSYAPREKPEIAVVIYIPNGIGGSHAERATKDILEYYLDGKAEETGTNIPSDNTLIP